MVNVIPLLAFVLAQPPTSIVHLKPNGNQILPDSGGKLLMLVHAPASVYLPRPAPKQDSNGEPWSIAVKNLGPGKVTIFGWGGFNAVVDVGETVHIFTDGNTYSLRH